MAAVRLQNLYAHHSETSPHTSEGEVTGCGDGWQAGELAKVFWWSDIWAYLKEVRKQPCNCLEEDNSERPEVPACLRWENSVAASVARRAWLGKTSSGRQQARPEGHLATVGTCRWFWGGREAPEQRGEALYGFTADQPVRKLWELSEGVLKAVAFDGKRGQRWFQDLGPEQLEEQSYCLLWRGRRGWGEMSLGQK